MIIVKDKISLTELEKMSHKMFGNLVKAVVDVRQEIMVVDGGLHSDEEMLLLEEGSQQDDLWGINIHPTAKDDSWIEFDSLINIRPRVNNRSKGVESPHLQALIRKIVEKRVIKDLQTL